MCIIAASKIGSVIPDIDTIRTMWNTNPDGAGFMWADGKSVHISKGFMELEDFLTAIHELSEKVDTTNTAIVMHFRIGTSGGNIPSNTHPFPVVDKLHALKNLNCKCKLGVAHNGIIDIDNREGISDTMEYVLQVLAPLKHEVPNFLLCPTINKMITETINGSRLCFLEPNGNITRIGDWVYDSDTGIYYSNSGYKRWYDYAYYSDWKSKWYDTDDEGMYSEVIDSIKTIPLAFLGHNAVLVSPYGEFTETNNYPDELMLDHNANVYFYDYGNDVAVSMEGYRIYESDTMSNLDPNTLTTWEDIDTVPYDIYQVFLS